MIARLAFLLYATGITGAQSAHRVGPDRVVGGDSLPVAVTYAATGGSITRAGLYTAGPKAGAYHVTATLGEVSETASVTLTGRPIAGAASPIIGGKTGVPMGLSGLLAAGVDPGPYTMSVDGYNPSSIISQLANARRNGMSVLMNLAGGSHQNYLTSQGGSMAFDSVKWMSKIRGYDTPEIQAAVAAAVADGTIVGASVMDEPQNTSADNSWGPTGTMNKSRVDQMCLYVKNIFPTLPVGVAHDHRKLEPEKNYQHCDFLVSQYRLSKGSITDFRDGGLAFAKRSGMAILFGINVIHGGVPGTNCDKWGNDPRGKLCPMAPEEIVEWGLTLGSAGCGLNMWRYERAYFERSENQAAFKQVADSLAKLPRRSCTRS